MSLFDLQDVRIAIGSIATLDLPMVVDLIGIYGLKGPYCTLTTTNWFLQALSVIPRGSWGHVARHRSDLIDDRSYDEVTVIGMNRMFILPVQARRRKTHVYVSVTQLRLFVHLWSLGVLTAAGCGIGSVHDVVRSNLLVEPSEVEEGEM
ncbi:hypothetical protein F511_11669 [Dorcoceras hygrometricum]|uniref:Acyl-CoA dehydrogenase-related protein n=1 Tax=Dorcoceras hygrometricum TaxID=472368 RepID=A0A2Z7A2F2_9LAMI|nr:hypothetical protein F511_11669 [Dorcoceras hygrometricum]